MSKTIKQLAEDLQVSKTAIRKYMTDDFRREHTETDARGTITITPEGCKLIAEIIGNNRKPLAETTENTVSADVLTIPREVWDALQAQIKAQSDTVEAQRKQIEDYSARLQEANAALTQTATALQAAQALHAGTIQQQMLEAPKNDEEPQKEKRGIFSWKKKK